jgi:hypothetical protein
VDLDPTHGREHGTRVNYQLGCRCDYCRAANAGYQKKHRAGRRGTPHHRMPGFRLELPPPTG